MKKKIIIITLLLTIVITLICIPKTTYQKWFSHGSKPNDDLQNPVSSIYQTIFVVNDQQQLVGIKVPVSEIATDEIAQKWELLTSKMNQIPTGYSSPITPSTSLNKYEIKDQVLTLNVSNDITRSAGRLAIEAIAWTFCNDEIEEVILKTDGEVVKLINDYKFDKITKKMGTNFNYETSYLLEADYTTIVFYEDDYILPVTYFYNQTNKYDYMINKIFSHNDILVTGYEYSLESDNLVIKLNNDIALSEDIKQTFEATIKLNFTVDSFTVNGQNTVLYEKTFNKA